MTDEMRGLIERIEGEDVVVTDGDVAKAFEFGIRAAEEAGVDADHAYRTLYENVGFRAAMHAIIDSRTEAADVIAQLREALAFYADETAWNQPPIKTVHHELLGPAYENSASKVRWDRGKIARSALSTIEGHGDG